MIPSLPIEIIREIVLFSLPPLKQTTYGERYDLLLAYSLVDAVWKIIAQEELIKHLDLTVERRSSAEKVKMINIELSRREEGGSIPKVLSIRLSNDLGTVRDSDDPESSIMTLVKRLVEVEEIWIDGYDFGMLASERFVDWKVFTRLNKLHFIFTYLNETLLDDIDFTRFYSPTLTHLTLMYSNHYRNKQSILDSILQPYIFPSLTSFAYVDDFEEGDEQAMQTIPQSIATQLDKLVVYDLHGIFEGVLISDLSKLSKLESLSLRDVISLTTNFGIPPSLHNLTIARINDSFVEDATILMYWIQAIDHQQQLRSISFPISSQMNLEDEENVNNFLTQFTSERGIKITYTNHEEVDEENWPNMLDCASKLMN